MKEGPNIEREFENEKKGNGMGKSGTDKGKKVR